MKTIAAADRDWAELPRLQLEQECLDLGHGAAARELTEAAALLGGRASGKFLCQLGKPIVALLQ